MWKKIGIGVILLSGLFLLGYQGNHNDMTMEKPTMKTVEIKGEVQTPGVYELPWNATIADVLQAAGGLSDDGDLSGYNQTKNIAHGEVLVIPKKVDVCISINSASAQELDQLPGIGPKIAARIIMEREQQPFYELEDLKRVKGIGDKTFEKLKDQICL